MTTTPTPAERLDAFAAELHRLADLIAEGAVPVPLTPNLSWYLHGDDAHEKAAGLARALAPEWRANPYSRGENGYLSAVASVGGIGYDLSVKRPEVVEPEPPSVAFAERLNASVAEVQQRAAEALDDGAITREQLDELAPDTLVCRGHRVDEWRSCADCNPQGVDR